jgi:hypothetical protein
MASSDPFKELQLDHNKDVIKVLKVLPSQKGQLRFSFDVCPIRFNGPYIALSYERANPHFEHTRYAVTVDEHEVLVEPNLWDALCMIAGDRDSGRSEIQKVHTYDCFAEPYAYLSHEMSTDPPPALYWRCPAHDERLSGIWVNPICTDHEYKITEDCPQSIRRIYSCARFVLVWLDPEADDSKLAIQNIDDHCVLDISHNRDLLAVSNLLHRSYWSHYWNISEFLLAPKSLIAYGDVFFRWEDITQIFLTFESENLLQHTNQGRELVNKCLSSYGYRLAESRQDRWGWFSGGPWRQRHKPIDIEFVDRMMKFITKLAES